MTALIQGRTISYWPPQIGPRPDNEPADSKRSQSQSNVSAPKAGGKDSVANFSVRWISPAPDAEALLRDAKFSALILGTSLFRIVHSDMFMYRDWLLRERDRRLGLLFLNPFSPHAVGRERRDVRRSSQQSVLDSMRVAYAEAAKNPQIVPAIYDGPFRYTARAIDIGPNFESTASSISLVTSSHTQGISKGFQIDLNAAARNEPYNFYRNELIDYWMQALSNPPGHGISVIARPEGLAAASRLDEPVERITEALSSRDAAVHLFDDLQFHVTVSSLCRTQDTPYFGPLMIGQLKSPQYLPEHFGSFLVELAGKSAHLLDQDIIFSFARVRIDNRGYVLLEPGRAHDPRLGESIRKCRACVAEQVAEYAARYPAEDWSALLTDQKQQRFGPKVGDFSMHVTLGRAFSNSQSLPAPLSSSDVHIDLDQTISCPIDTVSVVHYAYRSLLRVIGGTDVGFRGNVLPDEHKMMQELGIAH